MVVIFDQRRQQRLSFAVLFAGKVKQILIRRLLLRSERSFFLRSPSIQQTPSAGHRNSGSPDDQFLLSNCLWINIRKTGRRFVFLALFFKNVSPQQSRMRRLLVGHRAASRQLITKHQRILKARLCV